MALTGTADEKIDFDSVSDLSLGIGGIPR